MNDSNPFDPAKFKLDDEFIEANAEAAAAKTAARRPARAAFVQLPYEQLLRAAGIAHAADAAVLIELEYRVFKTHRNPVELTNTPLRDVGISHQAKNRALRRWELAGAITVTWRGRKAPLVTVLWRPHGAQGGDSSFRHSRKRLP
jgi:hypothetical protein